MANGQCYAVCHEVSGLVVSVQDRRDAALQIGAVLECLSPGSRYGVRPVSSEEAQRLRGEMDSRSKGPTSLT